MPKTLLVTGASRGIGLETVSHFARTRKDISTIVMMARESVAFTKAITTVHELAPHAKVIALPVDVGDRESLKKVIDDVWEQTQGIDILVNNAGYTNPVPLQQVEFADFERTMAVNLYAPFTIVQRLLRHGNRFEFIVNIASTAGINGRSGWLTYSASKAAVINMSQVMREELAIYGTRVVCISPGRTATDLRKILAPDEDPSTIMQPESVAEVIGMLASPVGQYVDSENLVVRL